MILRIALLLLATWAIARLLGPAADLVNVLLLVGLLLLLIGALKARDAAGPSGVPAPNQQQKLDPESPRVRTERGGR